MRLFPALIGLVWTCSSAASPDVIASMQRSVSPLLVVRGEHRPPVSLAQRMSQLNVRAVSIAVVRDGRLDWARAYGFADAEWKIPATPTTLFQAGSISKPLTALAILQRVDAGSIDLDRNVNDYLRSWQLPDNEFTVVHKVTVRNILNHTAGLTVWGFPGYPRSAALPGTIDVLEGRGNTPAVRVWKEPDQSWRYSGGGYTILQLLLSEQAGAPFDELMHAAVLEPLGMHRSTYSQPLPQSLRAEAAAGYDRDGKRVYGDWHVYPEMAAAGLWTTASDLAKYLIAVQNANRGRGQLLSPNLLHAMVTPGLNDHGLGLVLSPDHLRFGHSGADEGFQANMTGFLDGRGGVVIMTNSDNGGRLAQELFLTLGSLYGWSGMKPVERTVVKLPHAMLDRLAGKYSLPAGQDNSETTDLEITREGDALVVRSRGARDMTLLPESDRRFFDREVGLPVEFDLSGTAITAVFSSGRKAVRN